MIGKLKESPFMPLPGRFLAYTEAKHACLLYRKRNPVPNDSKVGCSMIKGREHICLYNSCREWWNETRGTQTVVSRNGWKDSSPGYEVLRSVCTFIDQNPDEASQKGKAYNTLTLAEQWHQKDQIRFIETKREEMCSPQRLKGFCEDDIESGGGTQKCTLQNGNFCPAGRVIPDSLGDFGPVLGLE